MPFPVMVGGKLKIDEGFSEKMRNMIETNNRQEIDK